jgi:hypothetical protein
MKISAHRRSRSHGDEPSDNTALIELSHSHQQRISVTSVNINESLNRLSSDVSSMGASSSRLPSVRFSEPFGDIPEEQEDESGAHHTSFRRLSSCSSRYDQEGKGYLTKVQQRARSLDRQNSGKFDLDVVVQLLEQQDRLQKRQWLLLLGNIIQWVPVVFGAVYTFLKFSERQYQQNASGRIFTSQYYIQNGIVTSNEIQSLWELSKGRSYLLTNEHREYYLRNGFVVLPDFLTKEESMTLDKVVTHSLNEMSFPDILTQCSRKFHGEHYHSTVSHRFWQQPRISDMLSSLALDGDVPYMVTSEILEMPTDKACIPQWHWDFLTFPQNYNVSYTTGAQIWWSSEEVDGNAGGGLAFMPGSHKWANSVDEGASLHPCFPMNLFEGTSKECAQLLDREMIIPKLTPRDIVVFSRFTLHRSVSRDPDVPFKLSTGRKGYTLRVGSGRSIFKLDTMLCFPSHPTSNFQHQLKEGQRYDSIIDKKTGSPNPRAIYRPMNIRDSEEQITQQENGRRMSTSIFLHYSAQSIFRQKIKWKLAKFVGDSVNGLARHNLLDISCKAAPTPDVMAWN